MSSSVLSVSSDSSDSDATFQCITRKRARKTEIRRPSVCQEENERSAASRALGVDKALLQRFVNIARIALNPGTEAEGKNAERALAKSLLKHGLARSDIDKLVKPALYEDLLREGATFVVTVPKQTRSVWEDLLLWGVCTLFATGCYYLGHKRGLDHKYVFYGEEQNANTAAEVFADAWYTARRLTAGYNDSASTGRLRKARDSYCVGLAQGFYDRCIVIVKERNELIARVQKNASLQERARVERVAKAAEFAEKLRLRKLREREDLLAAEEDVKDAPEAELEVAAADDDTNDGVEMIGDFTFDEVLRLSREAAEERGDVIDLTGDNEPINAEQASALMLRAERDKAIKEALKEQSVKFKKARKASYKVGDAVAFAKGRTDAAKLSTGKCLATV